MLSRSLLRASKVRVARLPRAAVQQSRLYSSGHDDHHVAVDVSHLERPLVNENSFVAYTPVDDIVDPAPELQASYGHLLNPENNPDVDWTEQFLSNTSVLECLAEFCSTEFHVPQPPEASVLKAKYREQYVDFVCVKAPAMAKAGVSQIILHKLRDVYKMRSLISLEEIERCVGAVFGILSQGSTDPTTWRVTFNGSDNAPLWRAFVPRLWGLGDKLPHTDYRSVDQYFGKYPATNEEEAATNVAIFRGARGFMAAVSRGLTDEERRKIKSIILRNPLDDGLDDQTRAHIDSLVNELYEMPKEGSAFEKRAKDIWNSLESETDAIQQLYFYRQYTARYPVPEHMFNVALEKKDYKAEDSDIVLKEGEDYFSSPEAAAAKRKADREEFLKTVLELHNNVVKSGNKDDIALSLRMKEAVDAVLETNVQADLEIMHLLETTHITDRRKAEIAAIFAPASDPASDELLNEVLNPHPIATKLFGTRVKYMCLERPVYTEEFNTGNETIMRREKDWVDSPILKTTDFSNPSLIIANDDGFNSGQDELTHLKLIRLADSFLGINLASDSGVFEFENFVHTFDISPGEATLERTTTSPAPHHTFAELPIIKFDGWEDADEVPEGIVIPEKASHH